MASSANIYAQLKGRITEKGLLEKQPAYYTMKIMATAALLVTSWLFLLAAYSSQQIMLQLCAIAYLAFVTTQLALLGHDSGHRQVFRASWKNTVLGLITGNLLTDISCAYWINKHNQHHNNPNHLDLDPDLDIPLLAFSEADLPRKSNLLQVFIIKYQAYFFFPMLTLTFLDLQCQGICYLLQKRPKNFVLELILLGIHFVCYCSFLVILFGIWKATLFILMHQALTGLYMGSIFAPNHKGMPVYDEDSRREFLYRQVLTSRNVKSHPLTDFWYGGLNYQIEHHLFPGMPRNNLSVARHIIMAFCQEHHIPYTEVSFFQSYKDILQHLHEVSAPLRIGKPGTSVKRLPLR
ncbi:MAG TPA: fatty acid desaturase [Ktedonobacteraceae bacterium]|nr:fatty acid desaturase [Ktedonobacteraceae bacterium]